MKSLLQQKPQKYLKYALWIGLFLLVMGITAGLVSNSWPGVPLVLITVGAVLLLVWLIFSGGMREFWGQRSTQANTSAVLTTLIVVGLFLLLNLLGTRYNQRLDLTENQVFTLAPQTLQLVNGLNQPVKVWIFEPTPNPQDRELLESYRRQNPQFSYQYVDPQAQPGLVEKFGVQQPGEVFLEKGDRRQRIVTLSEAERLTEQRLTNSLVQITSDRPIKVYFLQGHGERSLQAGQGSITQASDGLTQEAFTPEPLNLAQADKVPDDATVLVLAGPQRKLLEQEVTALRDFSKRKGGLFVMVDPQTDPGLDEVLKDWGVTFGDRVIVDPEGGQQAAITIVTDYGPHPITEKLGNGISFYPLARPLILKTPAGVQGGPILLTSDRVQGQRIGADGQLTFDPAVDPQGVLTVGAALSRPATGGGESRLVAIGNSSFITDGAIEQQLNKTVFLNSVAWLSQEENRQSLAIRPKQPNNRRILFSPQQTLALVLGSLVFLPLIGVFMAIGVWWRRR
jgi:ABC-type uncharacterized transport system involved in gliding motility auxiliary subunit